MNRGWHPDGTVFASRMAGGEVHVSVGIDASCGMDASNAMKEPIRVAAAGPLVGDVVSRQPKTS